ncbi:MAG: hypothetical protein JST04_15645 [Bdellovibrionales bacterium]|nr:hypothetical protein [Bdellovibrionales bacterium]
MKSAIIGFISLFTLASAFAFDRPTVEISGVKYYLADEVSGQSYPGTARGYCVKQGRGGDNSANSAYDANGTYSPLAILDASGAVSKTFESSKGAWVITSISCF